MAGSPVAATPTRLADPIHRPPKWMIERWRQQDRWVRFGIVALAITPFLLAFTRSGGHLFFVVTGAAILFLPQEFALATLVMGLLALSLHAGFNGAYIDYLRFVILFGGSAALVWKSTRIRIRFPPTSRTLFYGGFICHIAVAVASTFVSYAPRLTLAKVMLLVACWMACSTVAGAIVGQHGSNAAERVNTALTLVVGPFLLANLLVYPFSAAPTTGGTFTTSGFRGLTGNPNSLGICAALMAPLLMAHFARKRVAWNHIDVARALGIFGLLFLVLLSQSRASGLALATSIAVIVVLLPQGRLLKYTFLAGYLCVCLVLTNPYFYARFAEKWIYKGASEEGLLVSRSELWVRAQEEFVQRPLLGHGYGVTTTSEAEFSNVGNYLLFKVEVGSSFWALLTQVGILGFIPLAVGLLHLLLRAALFAVRVKDPHLTAMLAVVVGLLVNSIFEAWIVAPGGGLLWVLLALCAVLDAVVSRMRPGPAPFPGAIVPG